MGGMKTIKRLAADVLGVGRKRIKIKNPLNENERKQLGEAITKANIRDLIKDKIVLLRKVKGRRSKGLKKKKTTGKRRGKKYSIVGQKQRWMERVRAQRKYLKELVKSEMIDRSKKMEIYLKIKGGIFRSKQAIYAYLKDNKILKKEE